MIYVLIIFVCLAVSVVFFPIGVGLDYSRRGRKWMIIWIGIRIPVPHAAKKLNFRIAEKIRTRLKLRKWSSDSEEDQRSVLERMGDFVEDAGRSVDVFRQGVSSLAKMSRHVRVRVRRLDVSVATANPALTGFSYGMMCAFAGMFPLLRQVHAELDFTSTTPRISFRVEVAVIPFQLLPEVVRFVRQIVRKKRASRRHDVTDSGQFAVA